MNSTSKPLSENQIVEFYREGYVTVEQLVPHDVIDSILKEAEGFHGGMDGIWNAKPFNFDKPLEEPALHQCFVEPNIIRAVEQIFETQARLYYGMLAVVRAKGGKGLPWHQDNQYAQVQGRALNTFVALCDITPDKAILWVAPRTHLLGTQPSKKAEFQGHLEAAVEPQGGKPLPSLKKGDVCIFDRNTYHRSLKNETNDDRFAYAAQYMELNARNADGTKDTTKPLAWDMHKQFEAALV
jgi:ectoine hydroxylase-related dioxygenase (phytanoyl-CoA dioxygenase family)